jgi:protein-S-isoprenylcysteine O-methyltransferase Ste14
MYLAVGATILGQALLLGQPVLVAYAGAFAVAVAAFVYGYEQPTPAHRFGDEYEGYQSAVPACLPRLRPWNGVVTPPPDHRSDDDDPHV